MNSGTLLHQLMNFFNQTWVVSVQHLFWMQYTDMGRLGLRTPCPVLFETSICSS